MVEQPKPKTKKVLGFFHSTKGNLTMINLTAKPVWQWSAQNTSPRSLNARTSSLGTSTFKQTLLPRSLDVNFSLKYRR
jgi:hypothetical protein